MRSRRTLRIAAYAAGALALAWLAFVGLAWRAMAQGPDAIGRFMAAVPGPAYFVMPFRTLWNHTRAGTLAVGDLAPDFDLPAADGSRRVRLSEFRDRRPVVLIFGSYT
ncbi:MAG TPA: hypothetical protein VFD43_09695 [Planctomycetota bacterium]|nr:hypothetical protein [Planctomycetota bacterium]